MGTEVNGGDVFSKDLDSEVRVERGLRVSHKSRL